MELIFPAIKFKHQLTASALIQPALTFLSKLRSNLVK